MNKIVIHKNHQIANSKNILILEELTIDKSICELLKY